MCPLRLAQVRVEAMKTITRRLHRLEDRFGLQPETEFDRRLRARIDAARRRLAEARERGELGRPRLGRTSKPGAGDLWKRRDSSSRRRCG
jgi:hypothetical protein